MQFIDFVFKASTAAVFVFLVTGCGMIEYPGQPGAATNQFSKIDLEVLESSGLSVYETIYDNRTEGKGVAAIVTRLYPNAKTFTSNVRPNSEGTVYRSKTAYQGAEVQMVVVPAHKYVRLHPNFKLSFFVGSPTSLDEIDDKNLGEETVLKTPELSAPLSKLAHEVKKLRWDLLRAGTLNLNGCLSYEITLVDFGGPKFTPSRPVQLETSLFQTSVRTEIAPEVKTELTTFLESNFPKGFNGTLNVTVKGQPTPVSLKLSVYTLKTLETAGYKIFRDTVEPGVQVALEQAPLPLPSSVPTPTPTAPAILEPTPAP